MANKARSVGAEDWLRSLPELVAGLEKEWSIRVQGSYTDGTEALVAEALGLDGQPCVLKLVIPRLGDHAANELTVLELAQGEGLVGLFRSDLERGALLVERLGRSLHELGLPLGRRQEILCATAAKIWRPAAGCGLPTGAEKARWLIEFIQATWDKLGRPCSPRAVDYAIACAERRRRAHDDERAVLVHGDVHEWNALEADGGFKLIDPDGLVAEPEYDLGVMMREDPADLLAGDPTARAARLARMTGLDPQAIWEWGAAERVSTGLLAEEIDLQPVGRQMLAVAERVVDLAPG